MGKLMTPGELAASLDCSFTECQANAIACDVYQPLYLKIKELESRFNRAKFEEGEE